VFFFPEREFQVYTLRSPQGQTSHAPNQNKDFFTSVMSGKGPVESLSERRLVDTLAGVWRPKIQRPADSIDWCRDVEVYATRAITSSMLPKVGRIHGAWEGNEKRLDHSEAYGLRNKGGHPLCHT